MIGVRSIGFDGKHEALPGDFGAHRRVSIEPSPESIAA